MADSLAEAYEERGYDVTERGGSLVLDTPNPDVHADEYFHGANPHTVGFGSRGLEAEGGGLDLAVQHNDGAGEATADIQNRNEASAGWRGSGEGGDGEGEPDQSWTNARLRAYADENGIDTSDANTKAELLAAING